MKWLSGVGAAVLGGVLACGGGGPSASVQAEADRLKPLFEIELPATSAQIALSSSFGLLHANGAVLTFLDPADGSILHTQTLDCEPDLRGVDDVGFTALHLPCSDGTARLWKPDAPPVVAEGRPVPAADFSGADDRQAWTAASPREAFTGFSAYGGPEGVDLFDGRYWLRRLDTASVASLAGDGHGNLYIATPQGVLAYEGTSGPRSSSALQRRFRRATGERVASVPRAERREPTAAPPTLELEATLERTSRGVVSLARTSGPTVENGARATLSKHVQKQIFGADVSMWVTIAEVEVTSVAGDRIQVKILEEKSETVVNGKKVDMFTAGSRTRLSWAP